MLSLGARFLYFVSLNLWYNIVNYNDITIPFYDFWRIVVYRCQYTDKKFFNSVCSSFYSLSLGTDWVLMYSFVGDINLLRSLTCFNDI